MAEFSAHVDGTISWLDLGSTDAPAARAFYGAVIGWEYVVSGPEYGHYATARFDGKRAAGIGGKQPGDNSPSYWTVYFATSDLVATVAKAVELGAMAIMPGMQIGDQGSMAVLVDPTGAGFGLWQPASHSGAQIMQEAGAMSWAELNTSDVTGASEFYGRLFGLQTLESPNGNGQLLLQHPTGGRVASVQPLAAGNPLPHWSVYLQVADADSALAAVAANGGTVLHGPMETWGSTVALVRDPTGAVFTMVGPGA